MNKKCNSILVFLLVAAVLLSCIPAAAAANSDAAVKTAEAALQKILASYENRSGNLSDWEAMVLAINGRSVPHSHAEDIEAKVKGKKGVFRVATDYARTILAWKATGGKPTDVGGYNLVEKLYNYENISYQGVTGPMWALIALSGEDIPSGARWTRERLLEEMLSFQNGDGGFPLTKGSGSDVDLTGMALIALSGHRGEQKADAALEKAVKYLISVQLASGGFASWKTENSESTSQVIIGLAACGISSEDPRFQKQGVTLVDVLMKYRDNSGLFKHIMDGAADNMATEQAAQALTAVIRYNKGGGSIYNGFSGSTSPDNSKGVLKPVLDTGTADSPDANGRVTVRAEGRDKTCLPETSVGIVAGQTTLAQAVLAAIEKTHTPYSAAASGNTGHLVESIAGEYDWQWLVNGQGGMVTPDKILEDGDAIVLVDGYIWNPVLTRLSVPTASPVKNASLTVLLTADGKPLAGQKINFAGASMVTDAEGKADFKPDRTGTFLLTAETTGSYIRPVALPLQVKSDAVLPVTMKLTLGSKTVLINGLMSESETAPYTAGGRTMVSIRLIAENLGAVVEWDNITRTATFLIDGVEPFSLTIGVTPPGFDAAPEISGGSVMAPVRYVSEKLGAAVDWDNAAQTVTITKAR